MLFMLSVIRRKDYQIIDICKAKRSARLDLIDKALEATASVCQALRKFIIQKIPTMRAVYSILSNAVYFRSLGRTSNFQKAFFRSKELNIVAP